MLLLIAKCLSISSGDITHDSRKLLVNVFALILRIKLWSGLNFVNLKWQKYVVWGRITVGTTMMLQCRQWNLYIHLLFHRIKILDNKYISCPTDPTSNYKTMNPSFLTNYDKFYWPCLIIFYMYYFFVKSKFIRCFGICTYFRWTSFEIADSKTICFVKIWLHCAGIYILVSTRPTVGANQMLQGHWMQKIYFWIMNANVELIWSVR